MVAFVTYFVLILLFFTLREKHLSSPCDSKHCIRLCCGDLYTCNDSIMSENFNKSFAGHWLTAVSEEKVNGTFESVKVLFGRPSCKLDLITDDSKWKFDYVSCNNFLDFIAKQFKSTCSTAVSTLQISVTITTNIAFKIRKQVERSNGICLFVKRSHFFKENLIILVSFATCWP